MIRPVPWRLASLCAAALLFGAAPAGADEPAFAIELEALDETAGQCVAALRMRNDIGETIDRIHIELQVLNPAGVAIRRFVLDSGPMRNGRELLAALPLLDGACADIGRLRVAEAVQCLTKAGAALDCAGALRLASRAGIELDR